MLSEEKHLAPPNPQEVAVAETEVPKKAEGISEATPLASGMTREEFTASLEQLTARAKAAGLRPLQVMAQTYFKQGIAMLDGLLKALDESNPKKPAEAPDDPTKKKG